MVGDRADQAVLAGLEVDRRLRRSRPGRASWSARRSASPARSPSGRSNCTTARLWVRRPSLRATRVTRPARTSMCSGSDAVLVEAHLDAAVGCAGVGDVGAAAAHREGGQRDEEQRDASARHDLTYDGARHGPTPSSHRRRARRDRRRSRRLRLAGDLPEDRLPAARTSSTAPSSSPSAARAATRSTSSAPRAPRSTSASASAWTGPNFNTRHETPDNVLYALRNGGFSGAIMPENIVVGKDADDVAAFLSKYAGSK